MINRAHTYIHTYIHTNMCVYIYIYSHVYVVDGFSDTMDPMLSALTDCEPCVNCVRIVGVEPGMCQLLSHAEATETVARQLQLSRWLLSELADVNSQVPSPRRYLRACPGEGC